MSSTHRARGLRQWMPVAFFALSFVIAGCSDGGGSDDPVYSAAELNIAGSVGDGPVVNADLSFIDAEGVLIGQARSDDRANYTFVVPEQTALPVRVVASGGTDLVTGRPLDFDLVGVLGEDAATSGSTLNLSPLSTMTVRALECTGARFSFSELSSMWTLIRDQIGMGLNPELLPNPLFDEINADNVAAVVYASEALAEVIRRSALALTNAGFETAPADVFTKIACDLSVDHRLDGVGRGADQRVSAVYRAAAAAVAVEVAAGRLAVDHQVSTSLLDAAVAQIVPDAAGQTVLAVPLAQSLQSQLLDDLLLLQGPFADSALEQLIDTLQTLDIADLQRALNDGSLAATQQSLAAFVDRAALADATLLTELSVDMASQPTRSAPFISLFASQTRALAGEPVTLSWAASEARSCSASGAWSGERPLSGSTVIDLPTQSGDYSLTCTSLGGVNTATVRVTLIDSAGDEIGGGTEDGNDAPAPIAERPAPQPTPQPPAPAQPTPGTGGTPAPAPSAPVPALPPAGGPDVTLRASRTAILPDESVNLSWSSDGASSCEARGAWSGNRALSGSLDTGPLSSTARFELVCTDGDTSSSAIAIVQVAEDGTLNLSWNAPTEHEDGRALANLEAFKIYYGQAPGQYSNEVLVNDPDATSYRLTVPKASYYVVVTAVDSDGVESGYSNEIVEISR